MIRFNNDYNCGAHPEILKALGETNYGCYAGYGQDEWCEKAAGLIRKSIGRPDADVHFLVGGTQTNMTVIAAALRPYQSVISADSGHINVHETGAVENTGHKIETVPAVLGKITARQVEDAAVSYEMSTVPEHITQPGMVYISFSTEYGTVYSKKELEDLYGVCREHGLYLFIDGARLGYGLAAPGGDVTMKDIADNCDVFYIGGTKCGALFGEAVVILNDKLKPCFRNSIKQNGGMLAKGWLLGLQFAVLFENGLYFDVTKKAVEDAALIKRALADAGIPEYIDSPTNQIFAVVTDAQAEKLAEKYVYEYELRVDESHVCIRFCTSWSSRTEDAEALAADIRALR